MREHQEESVVIDHDWRRTVDEMEDDDHDDLEFTERDLFDKVIYLNLVPRDTPIEQASF